MHSSSYASVFSYGKLERVRALPIEIIANWRHVKIKADDYTTVCFDARALAIVI